MSELLPLPDPAAFPELAGDPAWVRELPVGTMLTRIYRSGGAHPSEWSDFREHGPLDGRFDPHPEPVGPHPGIGVMYTVLESAGKPAGAAARRTPGEDPDPDPGRESDPAASAPLSPMESVVGGPFAAALLEVFQAQRMIRRSLGSPVLAMFEIARPLRLLDLADGDWIAVAGGNAAISSGDRSRSRAWARAIAARYPELDGVVSASSLVPSARVATLWSPAATALPRHPLALLPLDRDELTGVIDAIADRYGYALV